MKSLIAIPCYNEERTIGSVILKAKQYADTILVVDDGSKDSTKRIAEAAGAKVIHHKKNFGYGKAIQSSFQFAKKHNYDIMTIIDGDGQHNADDIPKLMRPVIEDKVDITIGCRFNGKKVENVPAYRKFGINIINVLSNFGNRNKDSKIKDSQSGFRTYSKKAIDLLYPTEDDMGASTELIFQARDHKLRFFEEPIICSYDGDTSTKNPFSHGIGVVASIIRYMELKHSLLFFGLPGFILTIIGLISGFWLYTVYESVGYIPFGPAILITLTLVIGFLLGMTGLILHAIINANNYFYKSNI